MAPVDTGHVAEHVVHLARRMTVAERLTPAGAQKDTLIALGVFIVGISILWFVPLLKYALYPWKIWVVVTHEFCHAAAGCCTGARILSIEVNPDEGGVTLMKGGANCWTLPAGYLGSSFIGALLVFAGFDSRASKVASIFVGVIMLITLWWAKRSWFTLLSTLFAAGLMVACWFIAHGTPLRYYMLFVGTMSSLYALYDVLDDLVLRKVNESDASQFAKHFGGSARAWGVLWLIIALIFFAAGILAGLATWKDTAAEMAADSAKFLPTR